MKWLDFWNADTPIYVSERHKLVHYARIADDLLRVIPGPNARVMDYGCGEALSAERVAGRCAHLYLCDGAEFVRNRLRQRLASVGNVTVLAPEDLDTIPDHSLDLIVANSLLQYLSRAELEPALEAWQRKLAASGKLILADVIPHNVSAATDALALLRFAAANGFLLSAIVGLGRTFFSDYRRVRSQLGLTHYGDAELLDILRRAGFSGERLSWNFGHNAQRMAFAATYSHQAAPRVQGSAPGVGENRP
jgi:SAM-dependent methyltransferase